MNGAKKHEHDVPTNSLKFFWADYSKYGGFASIDVDDDALTLTMIDSSGETLHQQKIIPRV